jgi:MFS family permease
MVVCGCVLPFFDLIEETIDLNEFKVLHLGNLLFLAFNLGCALSPNTVSLIVFRFLGTSWNCWSRNFYSLYEAGLAGSAPIACGSSVISDLFLERERASAMALYSIGPMIGESYLVL